MLRTSHLLALTCMALTIACSNKPSSVVLPNARAALGGAPPSQAQPKSGPLEISYFAPQGETEGQVEVSVSFDRPMVALGADDALPAGSFTIEPSVPGRARWIGSQTLLFEPSAPLPMASTFTVQLAAGVRALDGNALAEPLRFQFHTPAPKLVRSDPYDHARGEERARVLDLYFNQRIDPLRVKEALTLVASVEGATQPVPFEVARPEENDPRRVRVTPAHPFPLGAEVQWKLRAGMASEEGPRALPQDHEGSFKVFGPLRLLATPACGGEDCVPRVVFSNPVSTRAALARLRFEPPLPTPIVDDSDYRTDTLYLGDQLAPDTTYRVRVEGELRDIHGNKLTGGREVRVRTPPLAASARLLVHGDLVAMQASASVPKVRALLSNLVDAKAEIFSLRANEVFPSSPELTRPHAQPKVMQLGAAKSTEQRAAELDVESVLQNGRGLLLVRLTARGQGVPLREDRLLAFTDLAPTLKASSRGGLVYVTRLSDAQAVAGASVRIVRGLKTLATGSTDGEGRFAFSLPPQADEEDEDLAAVVQLGDDLSFTRMQAGTPPWELTDHSSYTADGPTSAHLFTERGVYRPGDALYLRGIMRSESASGLSPTRGDVELQVLDASDSELERTTIALDEYGSFGKQVRIPGSVDLGPLTMVVTQGTQTFSASVEVAEYRPAELEVELHADRTRALRGERVNANVDAQYLFGAPAKGAHVYWSARYEPRSFAPASHAGFTFEDLAPLRFDPLSAYGASGEEALDERGQVALAVELTDAPRSGPSVLEIEASVMLDNTQASAHTTVDVTPADVVVGLRPASTLAESQKPLALELAALTPEGAAKPGVALEATLEHRVWTRVLVAGQPESKVQDQRVGSCRAKSAAEPVRCSVTPREPGLYVARVRAKDARGRVSSAAQLIYVYGAGAASWEETPGTTLSLKAERAQYRLGETAKILVPSPFAEAEALITVERDGVLSAEHRKLGSAGALEIAIDQRFVPNAFVTVLLLRPLSSGADGLDYRVGTIELAADVSSRKLAIVLTPDQADKRPGEEVTVQIAVRDGDGAPKQAALTVFAVDEGVLSLTGYRTPDPFADIYAPRALAVWTSDARQSLAKVFEGAADEKGGDEGGGGGTEMRSNFATVALFVPKLETDAEGRASVRFKLPDATTRYRIMAVGASRGVEVGSGETAVRTHKPLMLRPQLPRVLRAGDQLSAGVVIHNELARELDAEVSLEVTGLLLRDPPKQRVKLPAQGALEVRYALEAAHVGSAQLTFRASAGENQDAIRVERAVLSPVQPRTQRVAGSTDGAVREALAPRGTVRDDLGGLSISLSTSALADLEAPARGLLAYQYGCTEQLSSRLVALSALERLRKPLGLTDASLAPVASSLLAELERHQRSDGSFGLWTPYDHTSHELSAWLSAYALLALEELRQAGLDAGSHAGERARTFLASYLRDAAPAVDTSMLEQRAFIVYALARTGSYDPAYAGKLYEQRAALTPLARIQLAHALSKDPERRALIDPLLAELSPYVRVSSDEAHLETNEGDGYALQFVSDVSASSQFLLLLLEHAPKHTLVPKLARWLSSARGTDGAWHSTQESAWGVMALGTYLRALEPHTPDLRAQVQLGAQTLGPVQLTGHRAKASFALAMRDLPADGASVQFDKVGRGVLHYALSLEYAERELPTQALERGFFVERSYERLDPASVAAGETKGTPGPLAKIGDYVRVTLRVAVPSARRFVLLVDPLPAGLEPVDFTLASEFTGAANQLRGNGPVDHQELRDDRAIFAVSDLPPGVYRYSYLARASSRGTFVVPAASVSEMYHPETSGQTAAEQFRVEAP